MFVELIESLRCPRSHEESALVASATRTESGHIVEGVLGCPVCGAEFRIANGVAHFDEPPEPAAVERADAETAMRIAAFLELTDGRGFALLCGRWGAHMEYVLRLTQTPLVLVNPPSGIALDAAAGVVMARGAAPFAPDVVRAAALDHGTGGTGSTGSTFVDSVIRSVRPGGRLLGPASLRVTHGVTEIARDERMWVGEKTATPDSAPRLVSIKRTR